MRPTKLLPVLIAVLWTLALVIEIWSIVRTHDTWGSAAVILALAASTASVYLTVCSIVDRSRAQLLNTLLEALERTEQDVVQSISGKR